LVPPPGPPRSECLSAPERPPRLASDLGVATATELWDELVANSAVHAGVTTQALAEPANADGLVLSTDGGEFAAPERTHVAPKSAYSLRLVVQRTLYDAGSSLANCDSMAELAPAATVRLSPADAAPSGIENGTRVTVSSSHGSVGVPAVVDAGVPRGAAVLHHNLAGADPGLLVDADDVVCDVRVEVS
ncbi:MAG: molybdopterin dinucleotide binding domain-containing protein, partial [Microthrixaceae bacterium]